MSTCKTSPPPLTACTNVIVSFCGSEMHAYASYTLYAYYLVLCLWSRIYTDSFLKRFVFIINQLPSLLLLLYTLPCVQNTYWFHFKHLLLLPSNYVVISYGILKSESLAPLQADRSCTTISSLTRGRNEFGTHYSYLKISGGPNRQFIHLLGLWLHFIRNIPLVKFELANHSNTSWSSFRLRSQWYKHNINLRAISSLFRLYAQVVLWTAILTVKILRIP